MFGMTKETPLQYQQRKERVAAERYARAVVQQEREQTRAQSKPILEAAHQYRSGKQYQAAIEEYTRFLELQPNHKGAYLYRGQCYAHLDHLKSALSDYQRALDTVDPMFKNEDVLHSCIFNVCCRLAEQAYSEKEYLETISYINAAKTYASDPKQKAQQAWILGRAYLETNKLTDAYIHSKSAIEKDSDNIKYAKTFSFIFKKYLERHPDYKEKYTEYLEVFQNKWPNETWVKDDVRWLEICRTAPNSISVAASNSLPDVRIEAHKSYFETGEREFKSIVLNWKLEDIQRVERLRPLKPSYADVNHYYQAMLPLILEETKASMRQLIGNTKENFTLEVQKVTAANNELNPSKLYTSNIPQQYLEASQGNIALWLTGTTNTGSKFEVIGLANVIDGKTEVKCIIDTRILKNLNAVTATYLGTLITYERMFAVCNEAPDSVFARQIATNRLEPWPSARQSSNISIDSSLDESQKMNIADFLSAPINNLYLLQGPPGTGKTTTLIELIREANLKGKRILVSAPSNKAIQEIATRLQAKSPEIKMLLAGVEEKLTDELVPIFVRTWHAYHLKKIQAITQHFSDLNGCKKLLLRKEYLSFTQQLISDFINQIQPIMNFYLESSSIHDLLNTIRRRLKKLVSASKVFSGQERKQCAELLGEDNEGKKTGIYEDFLKRRIKLNKSLEKFAQGFVDSEDNDLIMLEKADVVFASLSVCGRQSLQRLQRGFDILIIDEAGQALQPEILIPFRLNIQKVLVVGDPMQLPATTLSSTATQTGFDKSTMESLINNNAPYRMLEYQYRMAPDIRCFPSKAFYQDRLQDGSIISTRNNPYANVELFPYSVVDIESGTEKRNKDSYFNLAECQAVVSIVNQLRKGHPAIQIGVITFYSAQVEKLKELLGKSSQSVTVSTVDGFQGGECDCIIVSCVRANPSGRVGFVEDPRRINVALTRARFGMIILGHVKTLEQSTHILKNIIDDASERDKLLDESVIALKTKPKKQGAEFCRFFAKGNCRYGNKCKFPHVKPPEEETSDIRNLLEQTNIEGTTLQKK